MNRDSPGYFLIMSFPGKHPAGAVDHRGPCEVLSHVESIELFRELGVKFTPELKSPSVQMPFEGDYTQEQYAQQMTDEYRAARVSARDVWPQSFNLVDVLYWINNTPRFGWQAVFLDDRV